MNNRQRQLLLQLVTATDPLTSEQLGKQFGVSSRTIKMDMAALGEELPKHGAQLTSRRNQGYSLTVEDSNAFQTFYAITNMRGEGQDFPDERTCLLHVARKLVASRRGVLIDEIAESLFLSRAALQDPLRQATEFCESFHLRMVSKPGQGLRVEGDEHSIRMAMTELFEFHFHRVELDRSDEEYARWIGCAHQERQDIRHTFLRVLRVSGLAVRDSISQRIAMYLILARNRFRAGLKIQLPERWIREVKTTPVWRLADDIYASLASRFAGYEMDNSEICFLAIYIMANLDPDLRRAPEFTIPYLASTVHNIAENMLATVKRISGTDLAALPNAQPLLEQVVLPMLAGIRYGIDGHQNFDWSYESSFRQLPLEMHYARLLAGALELQTQCQISDTDLMIFSCYMAGLLRNVQYPLRPQRLLATASIGVAFAQIAAQGLQRRWPELVESIQPVELYEIRGVDPSMYDAVLVGYARESADGSDDQLIDYNYDKPGTTLLLTRQGRDFGKIYNSILINAYLFEEALPPEMCMAFQDEFLYYDTQQAFQFLCTKYAKDRESEGLLLTRLRQREAQFSMARQSCAVVFGDYDLCEKTRLDLYQLSKPGRWGRHKIQWILFVSLPGNQLNQIKAISTVLDDLTKHPEKFIQFAQSPRETLLEILRDSVKI